jgi:SNF2 family DNA or RNA helicase
MAVLPLDGRRHLVLPAERLRAVLQVLGEMYNVVSAGDGRLRLPDAAAGWLAQFADACGGGDASLRWKDPAKILERGRAIARGPATELPPPPPQLRAELRPYQREGLAFLQHIRELETGGVLADDMGLGKTLQTIAHLVVEKASGRMRSPALVLAPTSLVGNWCRELKKFAPHLRVLVLRGAERHHRRIDMPDADVVITSYPLIVRDRAAFVGMCFHALVCDEAQAIKNVRSQVHQAVKSLDADHRICLTGTPIENNLEELWALFDLLVPGLLGDAAAFRGVFRYPIEKDGNATRLASLRDRIAPYVIRRMKDQVASELPGKTEIVRTIELHGPQRDLYESIRLAGHALVRKAVKQRGIKGATIDILGALMKLRQVCCDPRLVRVSAAQAVAESAKLTATVEMIEQMLGQGRRILVFSQFATMLGLIARELSERKIAFSVLTGATADREQAVDVFQSGRADVFLISLKAGGTGLNLTRADTVIHYDPWWNPAAQNQATDRAHRIGQKRPVFVYKMIVAGSVEERMLHLQKRKQSLADALLAAPGTATTWTEHDVDDLFAPLSAEPEHA